MLDYVMDLFVMPQEWYFGQSLMAEWTCGPFGWLLAKTGGETWF